MLVRWCDKSYIYFFSFCSNHVRNAATNALLNSLEFTKANFDKDVSIYVCLKFEFAFF